jgi:hemoglobin-like flavoprotein
MPAAEILTFVATIFSIGTGAFVVLSVWDKYLKAQVEIAKEKSVGAKAMADLTERIEDLEKIVKHWDQTYKDIINRFIDYLNKK